MNKVYIIIINGVYFYSGIYWGTLDTDGTISYCYRYDSREQAEKAMDSIRSIISEVKDNEPLKYMEIKEIYFIEPMNQ